MNEMPSLEPTLKWIEKQAQDLKVGDRLAVGSELTTVTTAPQVAQDGRLFVNISGGSIPFVNLVPGSIVKTMEGGL